MNTSRSGSKNTSTPCADNCLPLLGGKPADSRPNDGAEAAADAVAGHLLRGMNELARDPARLKAIERLLV